MWKRVSVIVLALVVLSGQGVSERDGEQWFGSWLLLCRKLETGESGRVVTSHVRLNDAWAMFVFGYGPKGELAVRLRTMSDAQFMDSHTRETMVLLYLDDTELAPIQLDCEALFCTSDRLDPKLDQLLRGEHLKLVFPDREESDTVIFELFGLQEALENMARRFREKLACAPRL
jgi:hypothetical protein